MDKLLIVDGHNLLFQMFYGMPSRIVGKGGKSIHGVLGFVGALIKIIKMTEPSHLVVLFDGEHENARAALNPDYKKNRTDYSKVAEQDNPFSQLEYVYRALDILSISYSEEGEYEVDDIIASYVYTYNDIEIIISSFDSDYFQLIRDNLSVLRYRGAKSVVCDRNYVIRRFGVLPELYADFKSLTGDVSDNIKGADKIGPKTAAKLINLFGGLEQVLSSCARIESARIRTSVMNNERRLRNNYQLIKLKDVGKIPFELNELSYVYNGLTTNNILERIGLL